MRQHDRQKQLSPIKRAGSRTEHGAALRGRARRRRRLPAEHVVWPVIGMDLFRDRAIAHPGAHTWLEGWAVYSHHGTVSEADAHLIAFQPGPPNAHAERIAVRAPPARRARRTVNRPGVPGGSNP